MTSRFFSLVAVPIALLGHLLFWAGSAGLLRSILRSQQLDVGSLALAVVGILVILVAVASVAIGSLGAYVVGAVQILFSLLLHVVPLDPLNGVTSPAFELMAAVRDGNMEISDGMFFYFPPGIGAITGAIFLAAAFAADRRTAITPSPSARLVAALAGVAGLLGLLLAIAFGARVYIAEMVTLSGAEPLDTVLLYAGVVVLAVAVAVSRWSSAGVLGAAAIVTIGGLIGLAAPLPMIPGGGIWVDTQRGLQNVVSSGSLLLIGLLLLVAGLAVRIRARRRSV